MPDAVPSPRTPVRRLTFTLLAGLNLWLVATALPMLVGLPDAPRLPVSALAGLGVAALGAVALLMLGLRRRSDLVLLGLVPAMTMLPAAVASAGQRPLWAPPPLWALVLALTSYLLAAAFELRPSVAAGSGRPVQATMSGHKWTRRERIYGAFAVAAALFPAVLTWQLFAGDARRELELTFVGHAGGVRALLVVAVALVSLSAQRVGLLAPLQHHLEVDPSLRSELTALKRVAQHGRPRAQFYIWVALALAGVVATAWMYRQ